MQNPPKIVLPNGKKPVTVILRVQVALEEGSSPQIAAAELIDVLIRGLSEYEDEPKIFTTTLDGWDFE